MVANLNLFFRKTNFYNKKKQGGDQCRSPPLITIYINRLAKAKDIL